jgi:APA family basic amino acid/polyamine antiporter
MNYTKGLVEQFKFLILLSTLLVLVPYLFSTAAYIIIRLGNKNLKSGKDWIPAIALASLAFIFSLWAIIGSGQEIVYWGFILLMAGLPFYVMVLWKKKS